MQNENGRIITHTNRQLVGTYSSAKLNSKLKLKTENHFIEKVGKTKNFVSWKEIGNTGWFLVKISDYDQKFKELSAIKIETFLFLIVVLVIYIIVTILISYGITVPIKKLKKLIHRVENGDLEAWSSFEGNDEIAELGRSFNQMILKVNELIKKIKEEQKLKEKLQLDLMQAQINPHFIFNTLNTIKWTAIINQATNTAKLIEDFGRIIGTCFKGIDKLITVDKELSNLKSYLNIQKARFNYPFREDVQIPRNIYSCMIPKLILQPLVENSITHGYGEHYEKCLNLLITAYQKEDKLIIIIQDDGCGISEAKLNQIMSKTWSNSDTQHFNGIGLFNVQKRIQLMFGEDFGLQVESQIGKGTTVKLVLPLIVEDDHYGQSDDC